MLAVIGKLIANLLGCSFFYYLWHMTIKPLTSDTILRHIDEDNKKFFRSNIARVSTLIELYRIDGDALIPDPVVSCSRSATSFTELLVYIPELLVDFFNYNKQYEPGQFYTIAHIDITPIVGTPVSLTYDPLNLSAIINQLLANMEEANFLKLFNDEESKRTPGVAKE